MKIKQEFWDLIKSGKKTIELRKVNKLQDFIDYNHTSSWDDEYQNINGRLGMAIHDEKGNYIGSITINGYSIIKNPFKIYSNEVNCLSNYLNSRENAWKLNERWVYQNWDWLVECFKDEKEILVLNIEKWDEE